MNELQGRSGHKQRRGFPRRLQRLQQGHSHRPGTCVGAFECRLCRMRAGDLKDAQLLVKRAMELDPASLAHAIRYAGIAYRLGNRDEALSLLRDLLPKMPNSERSPPSGWGHRAIIREILK